MPKGVEALLHWIVTDLLVSLKTKIHFWNVPAGLLVFASDVT